MHIEGIIVALIVNVKHFGANFPEPFENYR